jgi:hypothetical protein
MSRHLGIYRQFSIISVESMHIQRYSSSSLAPCFARVKRLVYIRLALFLIVLVLHISFMQVSHVYDLLLVLITYLVLKYGLQDRDFVCREVE